MVTLGQAFILFTVVLLLPGAPRGEELPGDDEKLPGMTSAEILASDWSAFSVTTDQSDDGKTMDEIVLAEGVSAGLEEAADEGLVLFQGDMLMQPQQFNHLYNPKSATFSGAAVTDESYRWPHGIIPYTIDSSLRGEPSRVAMGAMKEWMERTCIRFEPAGTDAARKAGHNNQINIVDGAGCRAGIGYWGRSFSVSLSKRGCTRHKSHLHELGHVIGLHHEQCRTDRDSSLKIVWDNISMMGSLQYTTEKGATNYGIPYDFCSIMHYGPKYFSSNRKFTMLTKDQDYQWTIGSAANLSFDDAKIVNMMYKCNQHCPRNPGCKAPCYVNHKCQCECQTTPCKKIPCLEKSSARDCDEAKRILARG